MKFLLLVLFLFSCSKPGEKGSDNDTGAKHLSVGKFNVGLYSPDSQSKMGSKKSVAASEVAHAICESEDSHTYSCPCTSSTLTTASSADFCMPRSKVVSTIRSECERPTRSGICSTIQSVKY